MTVITDSQINLILKNKDKEVVLKYLLDEKNFDEIGVDIQKYEKNFTDRNGISLAEIKKNLENQGLTEVNESDVDKVLNLISISKAEDISSATEGIVFALSLSLNWLYGDSKWMLERFTDAFTGNPDNAEIVKLINNFNFTVKSVKDNLTFLKFNNGQITGVPVSKSKVTVKKFYDDWSYYYDDPMQVDKWDIREINYIVSDLGIAINLLDALIKIFPDNSEFSSFKVELETALSVINDFNDNFKDIVILANSLDIIRVEPKALTPKSEPVIFYNDPVSKSKVVKKKYYDVSIVKNDSQTFEGLVTGIVYEPETPDADGNYASAEVIEKAMRTFMTDHYQFDVMHDLNILKSDKGEDRQVALIQNFIAPQDLNYGDRVVKKGTWIQETQYFDEEIKKKIADGTYKGYSLYGLADIAPDK